MTTTNKPATKKIAPLRQRRLGCTHERTIAITDAKVCTHCEAVLPLQ